MLSGRKHETGQVFDCPVLSNGQQHTLCRVSHPRNPIVGLVLLYARLHPRNRWQRAIHGAITSGLDKELLARGTTRGGRGASSGTGHLGRRRRQRRQRAADAAADERAAACGLPVAAVRRAAVAGAAAARAEANQARFRGGACVVLAGAAGAAARARVAAPAAARATGYQKPSAAQAGWLSPSSPH